MVCVEKRYKTTRTYHTEHPKFAPSNPQKTKHTETKHFRYYSLEIGGEKYWANVKMRNDYGEVLYTIEFKDPEDIIRELPPQ